MANFSKNPNDVLKQNFDANYVGVLIEQGVPVLDRDLNLRIDLPAEVFRSTVEKYIGSGTPTGPATQFMITPIFPVVKDFKINPGTILVHGIEVTLKEPGLLYTEQIPLHPGLLPPIALADLDPPGQGQGTRIDCVYIDVWFDHIESAQDPELFHPDEYELQTSVRLKPNWVVRVAHTIDPPPEPDGHHYLVLATIERPEQVQPIAFGKVTDKRVCDLGLSSQAAQITEELAATSNLKSWLAPRFQTKPFSNPSAYVGMNLRVYGVNFDLGPITVEFGVGPADPLDLRPSPGGGFLAQSNFEGVVMLGALTPETESGGLTGLTGLTSRNKTWVPAEVRLEPTTDELTVIVPPGIYGEVYVAVTNGVGRSIAPRTLPIYGAPVWAPPGAQYKSFGRDAYVNGKLGLMGSFFDLPGTVVEVAGASSDSWGAAKVVDTSPLGCVVIAPKYPGQYWYRVKNLASPDFVTSTDLVTIKKP